MPGPRESLASGFVGEVAAVNPRLIHNLLDGGHIPIISSVATDEAGQAYNINADTVAGELAAALDAEKLILLTDTPGILQDYQDPTSLIHQLDICQARTLIEQRGGGRGDDSEGNLLYPVVGLKAFRPPILLMVGFPMLCSWKFSQMRGIGFDDHRLSLHLLIHTY